MFSDKIITLNNLKENIMTACLDELEVENYIEEEDLENKIKKYISNYFKDKNISDDIDLFSKKYIDLCFVENICSAVDKAYNLIETSGKFKNDNNSPIGEDVKFVIKILNQIRRTVPKEFCAGIFLMHLEIIEELK